MNKFSVTKERARNSAMAGMVDGTAIAGFWLKILFKKTFGILSSVIFCPESSAVNLINTIPELIKQKRSNLINVCFSVSSVEKKHVSSNYFYLVTHQTNPDQLYSWLFTQITVTENLHYTLEIEPNHRCKCALILIVHYKHMPRASKMRDQK